MCFYILTFKKDQRFYCLLFFLFSDWQHLSSQLDPKDNFKAYRATLKEAKLPCLPYIGVYLNDLVYAESSTSTILESGFASFSYLSQLFIFCLQLTELCSSLPLVVVFYSKVNFFKMVTISRALSSILRFQEKDFGFPMDKKMQQWFSFSMVVMDEELLLKSSLRSEPEVEEE